MDPLSHWSAQKDQHYNERRVLAFDLDDTLTQDAALPSFIVKGLEDLQRKSIKTILVTGRSAGWADALIKLMPFDAIVAENGGLLYYWPHTKLKKKAGEEASKLYWNAGHYGAEKMPGLESKKTQVAKEILKLFPGTRIASDQSYRIYDLAIDFAEEVPVALSFETAEGIQRAFEERGATARVSSIHVNGWWENFSKALGLAELAKKYFHFSMQNELIYVGDSPNDAPLFQVSGMSVGVANIHDFSNVLNFQRPQYVTKGARALGALELINIILEKK